MDPSELEATSAEGGGAELETRRRLEPWGWWQTLLLSLWVIFAYFTVFTVVGRLYVFAQTVGLPFATTDVAPEADGFLLSIAVLASAPLGFAMIAGLARARRWTVRAYLHLDRPRVIDVAIGALQLVVLVAAFHGLLRLFGSSATPQFVIDVYKSSRSVVLFGFAIAVVAPLFEEALFRGFLYQGLARTRLGPAAAVIVSALLWAAIHLQYDLLHLTYVYALGLFLGWIRYRTNSTSTCVTLHGLNNLVTLLLVMLLDRSG